MDWWGEGVDVVILAILIEEGCFPLLAKLGAEVLEDKPFSLWFVGEDELGSVKGRSDTDGRDRVGYGGNDRTDLIEV